VSAWGDWKAIPKPVRLEAVRLARAGQPYPDPAVRRAAIAWAEAVPRRRAARSAMTLVPAVATLAIFGAIGLPWWSVVLWLTVMAAAGAMIWRGDADDGYDRALGPVNRLARAAPPRASTLDVRASLLHRCRLWFGLAAGVAVVGFGVQNVARGALPTWREFAAPVLVGACAWGLVQRRRRPEPPLRVSADGLTFRNVGWTVPWRSVGSCYLVEAHHARRSGVRWLLRDPEAAVGTVADPASRERLVRWLRRNGCVITVRAEDITERPDEVVLACRAMMSPR
jgi:hypothetical protein